MRLRFNVLWLAPVLAFIALSAWAFASPIGSSPDDDFHLVSTWCASPSSSEFCQPGSDTRSRTIPAALVHASCYAFDSDKSAGCQRQLDFSTDVTTETSRGNFFGAYPPVYYATMGLLAGGDIVVSAVAMRLLTVLIFVGLVTALFVLLPHGRRPALVWSWVLTTVPLGLFVLSSNNPSSWAIMGVGLGWIALLGYFETVGRRRIALGTLFALCAVIAAGARGDAALYTILGIVAVVILKFAKTRRFALQSVLPLAVVVMCILMYRFSRPVASVTKGLHHSGGDVPTDLPGLIVYNILQGPSLWTGIFGDEWGLGWLDTSMPAIVWLGGIACFVGAGFVAVGRMSVRKLIVLCAGALVLWLLPTLVLVAAGDTVGENMQPRYLLPLIVVFTGVLMLAPGAVAVRLTRAQAALIAATLSVTHLIALHLNMQRYVMGFDDLGWNLNGDIEWWWNIALSPMLVWVLGATAYAALLFLVLPRMSVESARHSQPVPTAPQIAS